MYDEDGVKRLQDELQNAIADVLGDNPEIEGGFEFDLAEGVALCSDETRETVAEFYRREFGFGPTNLGRGYVSLDDPMEV